MRINIINKSNNLLPKYMTDGSAGMDLQANVDYPVIIDPFKRAVIPTGIFIELPDGYEAQIRPRSGLAFKFGVTVLNTPGTIDSDYRGEISIILINLGYDSFTINCGDRIAQMVISKYEKVVLVEKDIISETERGDGKFGSTNN